MRHRLCARILEIRCHYSRNSHLRCAAVRLAPVPGPSMEQGGSAGKSYDPPHFAFRGTQAGVEFATKHRKYVSALNKDRCACRSARAAHGLCARSCRAE